jgi:hypothetical protein
MNTKIQNCFLIFFLLFGSIHIAIARFDVSLNNFGTTVNVNPIGWTFTGVNMNINNVDPSIGYPGASGGAYLSEGSNGQFINTQGTLISKSQKGTSTATLQTSSFGLTNLRVSFAIQRSATYFTKSTYLLEWSFDGINFTPVNFKVAGGTNWNFAKGTGLTLPAAADNQTILYLRWTFVRNGGTRSFLKIDDFKLSADSICYPATILMQPVNPLAACVNTDSIEVSTFGMGSGLVTYQWQLDATDIINGGSYSGANSPQLVIKNPPYSLNGRTVRCLVISCKGSFITSTDSVLLTVYALPADINKDGIVDNDDFLLFNNKWNQNCNGCYEDINNDGIVNVEDFLWLLADFYKTCKQ